MSSPDADIDMSVAKPMSSGTDLQTGIEPSSLNEELPASKLPFDLLSNIFLLCQRTGSIEEQYSFPEIVSHVCKQWRATTLSTPLLWNTILLTRWAFNLSKLEAHLIRSDTCFLDIYITLPAHLMREVMNLLITCCRRWRKFYVKSDRKVPNLLLKHLHEVSTPVLEYIYLASKGTPYYPKFPVARPTILQDAPVLRFVHLSGPSVTLQPPLTNLTTLDLNAALAFFTEPVEFVRVFEGMRSLVNLSLSTIIHYPSDPLAVTTPVTLPLLRTLRICNAYDLSLFSLMVFPCLESLVLQEITLFHSPLLPSVKNLTLERCSDLTEDDLAALAQSCPSIAHFSTDSLVTQSRHFLTSTSEIPWPSLHKITLRDTFSNIDIFPGSGSFSVLRAIVAVRIILGHLLKEVFLDESNRAVLIQNDWLDWFEERVTLTFCDGFEGWSTISGLELPPMFADND